MSDVTTATPTEDLDDYAIDDSNDARDRKMAF